MELPDVYSRLLKSFGPQGWWPCSRGFSPPELEVCIGAILTQNTSWRNVELSLMKMKGAGCTSLDRLASIRLDRLEGLVRSSGYYRQKAERLRGLARFIRDYRGDFFRDVTREELLSVKGVGPETADSILLYACGKPWFVVDLYTRRVFSRLGLISSDDYHEVQGHFMKGLKRDVGAYKEFHALIVELAKRHCMKKPSCKGCPLGSVCRSRACT